MILDPSLHHRTGYCELLACIHSHNVVCVKNIQSNHLPPHGDQMSGSIGEVVFALCITGTKLFESVPKFREPERRSSLG